MKSKCKRGMTLIEIIIALALLGILSLCFLPLFTIGVSDIASAGSRSKAQYNIQSKIEQDINSSTPTDGTDSLNIDFNNNPSDNITISGQIKTQSDLYNGQQVMITYFVPNN